MTAISLLAQRAKRIDHIAIAVRDLEESIRWYVDVLGFEVLERRETKGSHSGMVSCVVRAGQITVVLLQGTNPQSQVSQFVENFGPGVQHIAFEVEGLSEVYSDLKDNGVDFDTGVIESPDLSQAFSRRDKGSGLMFELIERRGQAGFRSENVQSLFEELERKGSF